MLGKIRAMRAVSRSLALLLVLALAAPAFVSDPTGLPDPADLAYFGLVAGTVAVLVFTGLAALHKYLAIALALLTCIPGVWLAFATLLYAGKGNVWLVYLLYIASLVLYGWVTCWRIDKDWSKPPPTPK